MSISADVLAFRKQLNLPVSKHPLLLTPQQLDFYHNFVAEEFTEFCVAHGRGDIVAAADAIGDLIYLLHGCAHMMGIPIDQVLSAIHSANMAKISGTSKRGANDAVKPLGWEGPEATIAQILGVPHGP